MHQGELVENRVVVWDTGQARDLFSSGYYGKPLGVPKPKDGQFDAPLLLDLIEGLYLVEGRKLVVRDARTRRKLPLRVIRARCESEYTDFAEKYLVYTELRRAGYVVTPGIKFGSDFAVYERGPGIDHAPFLVQVAKPGSKMGATGIVLAGRLATTVRKQFIVALADAERAQVRFVAFDWWRA